MSKGIIETIGGAALIAGGAFLEVVTFGASTPLTAFMIQAGAGLVLTGIGTMIAGSQVKGFATTTRNPIAPWEVVVGRSRVGGTLVYVAEFGDNNKYLDMVVVLAAHNSESIDEVLFDNQRLQIGKNNTSFTPVQQTIDIASTSDITRVGDVVMVHLPRNIPLLSDGDYVVVQGVHPVATLLNGKFPVTVISRTTSGAGTIVFSYLCGGPPTSGGGSIPVTQSGQVLTQWQDYGPNVYVETINDKGPYNLQPSKAPTTLGTTFVGMTSGTPQKGDFGNGTVQNNANYPNPWTADCSLVGFTSVFIRLHYDQNYFPGGIPQISFIMRGKNDIVDPRSSPPTTGYTENAALIIADYLNNSTWGFNAAYGSEIDTARLIAAANVCDESVAITNPVGAFEPRYTCCGRFQLTSRRGDILQSLLTSCAGRITYVGGLFQIWPAAWAGSSLTLSSAWVNTNSAGPIRWRSTVSISNRFNGVKGTYISPSNGWQSSDFPRYAQDTNHGYTWGLSPTFDANLDYDGGQRRWKDIQLPFTISCDTAQRLAKIELMRSLQMGTGTLLLNMAGYQIAPLDVVTLSWTYFGWTNKHLEVLATRFKLDKQQDGGTEVVLMGVEIDVQETDSSVYDFALIEDLTPQGFAVPGVPNAVFTPDPPSNLAVAGGILTWTAPADAYVTTISARYQLVASPPGLWISLGQVDVSVTQLALPGLTSGELFTVELQSVNGAGVTSQWVSITTVGLPEFQWAPFQIQAPSNDALFPGEWTFDLSQTYTPTSGVDWSATANITGCQPVNDFILNSTSPVITAANVFVSSTGGSIPGGLTLYLAIGALDSNNNSTPGSVILSVDIPSGTNTNSVTIGDAFASIIGTFSGNPPDGVTLSISGKMYAFQSTLTNFDGNVHIGANLAATVQNLLNAINLGPGSGSAYAAAMTANGSSTATGSSANTITCTATAAGSAGNLLTASGVANWSNSGSFAGGASISWPAISGLAHYVIFASANNEDLICKQVTGSLTAVGSPPTGYTPTTGLSLPGPLLRSTWAMPTPVPKIVRVKGALLIHGGVEGAEVDSLTTTTITAAECIDVASPPVDNWAGRTLAIIGRNNGAGPFCSFDITAFNPHTGQFTVNQNPVSAGVQIGDALVVCTLGVNNSGNPLVISDPGLSNAQDAPTPHAGLIVNDQVLLGTTFMVIKGKSRGATAHIVSNTATTLTLDSPVPIDATSVWVILGRGWLYKGDSVQIDNTNFSLPISIPMQIDNAVGGSILVAAVTVDSGGVESLIDNAPVRMMFAWGAGMAEKAITANYQMLDTDQVLMCDTSGGGFTVTLPPTSTLRRSPRWIKKVDSSANVVTIQGFGGQTVEFVSSLVLTVQGDAAVLLPNAAE